MKRVLARGVWRLSAVARERRAAVFRSRFALGPRTRILDLGSADGAHVHAVLRGTRVQPHNVVIADIRESVVQRGAERFGFTPIVLKEDVDLPFEDRDFDIVHCSSVIEHVTVPKSQVWSIRSDARFRDVARARQSRFAKEIRRVGRQYFVQTPHPGFPIESHSWLPFFGYLPRRALLRLLPLSNALWIKKTAPDWCLINEPTLQRMFPEAIIVHERLFGLTKSLAAVCAEPATGRLICPPVSGARHAKAATVHRVPEGEWSASRSAHPSKGSALRPR
jgi:SAM-dependent methyltransferase